MNCFPNIDQIFPLLSEETEYGFVNFVGYLSSIDTQINDDGDEENILEWKNYDGNLIYLSIFILFYLFRFVIYNNDRRR